MAGTLRIESLGRTIPVEEHQTLLEAALAQRVALVPPLRQGFVPGPSRRQRALVRSHVHLAVLAGRVSRRRQPQRRADARREPL